MRMKHTMVSVGDEDEASLGEKRGLRGGELGGDDDDGREASR